MLVYSRHISPRLRYILGFIGKELFDEPMELTDDRQRFLAWTGPSINYSEEDMGEGHFYLLPSGLLQETGIRPQALHCFELNFHKAFFPTSGDLPFDLFSAAFYLLSRYEEYLPHRKDMYGRFAHEESLAYKEGFLDVPLVNIWIQEFRKVLERKFPDLRFRYVSFQFIPTYDIDIAWSWLHKGWKRSLGGMVRSVLKGNWGEARARLQVLRGRREDPFDAYEWLDSLHLYCRLKPCYFFLVAGKLGEVDRNIAVSEPAFQDLVRYHAAGYKIGVHPSWQSGDREALLKEEIEWIECMSDQQVTRSRQHYIRFTLPESYRRLVKYGIRQDYSMGYGSINGFRASVASSFYWYDVEREEETGLEVLPFCWMDANAYYEQKFGTVQAMTELLHYYHMIRKVNGLMITIWHNSFLGTDPAFAGWREVYEVFLKDEVYWDA